MPGGTIADPILQRDAINYARLGATVASKDCKQLELVDTHFEAFGLREPKTADPGPNARFRPWWETWTLVGCGRKFDVPINFIPDERGTTIAQALGDVKAR